jgi:hypothetical protein
MKSQKQAKSFDDGYACLKCGELLDCVTSSGLLNREIPLPGDISICLYCSNIAIFTDSGLRPPGEHEEFSNAQIQEIAIVLATMELYRVWKKAKNNTIH